MAGKTIKLGEQSRSLMDEVMDLLRRRGLEQLPSSVSEGVHELSRGPRQSSRITQAVVVHLGLLALRRHLDPEGAE